GLSKLPVSSVQQGLIVEYEFAKFLMLGTGGRIELATPMTDDERRDYEIHVHGQYGLGLACQVKSAMRLHRMSANVRYLNIFFDVRADRLVNSPFYWYFFAYLDPKLMGLADPTFLVPSKISMSWPLPSSTKACGGSRWRRVWKRGAGTGGIRTVSG